jgi:hypothetical protein
VYYRPISYMLTAWNTLIWQKTQKTLRSRTGNRSVNNLSERNFSSSQLRVWRWLSSETSHRVVWYNFIDVSEVPDAYIIRATMAASTSETSVNFYQTTRCNSQADSHIQSESDNEVFVLHKRRRLCEDCENSILSHVRTCELFQEKIVLPIPK